MSNGIYIPYFYIIQEVSTDMYYAGSKYGKNANPSNFMIEGGYQTTSEIIKELIRQHGFSNFIIRKIRTFETGEAAHDYETRFLQKVDARNHLKFYNGHYYDWNLYDNKNKVSVIDKDGNTFQTNINDPRYISRELKGISFGTKPGLDLATNKTQNFSLDDPRWNTGEIISMKKGKSHYIDSNENSHFVTKDKAQKLNLKSFSKTWVTVKDKTGNTFRVLKTDERYLSGELVGVTKNMIPVKDKEGNGFVVCKDDPKLKTGELFPVNLKKVIAKDIHGNKYRIDIDDPHYISGELVGISKGLLFYNNGKINKTFDKDEIIPEGFVKGRMKNKQKKKN
jgi:RNase P/RNase MRP subunit p29